MRDRLTVFFGALIVLNSGCQVSRTLKQPIPASQPVGIQGERTERIGHVIRDTMRKEGIPGVSFAVVDGAQTVWAQGFGWRDVGRQLRVDTETQFQASSIQGRDVLVTNGKGRRPLGTPAFVNSWRSPTLTPKDYHRP